MSKRRPRTPLTVDPPKRPIRTPFTALDGPIETWQDAPALRILPLDGSLDDRAQWPIERLGDAWYRLAAAVRYRHRCPAGTDTQVYFEIAAALRSVSKAIASIATQKHIDAGALVELYTMLPPGRPTDEQWEKSGPCLIELIKLKQSTGAVKAPPPQSASGAFSDPALEIMRYLQKHPDRRCTAKTIATDKKIDRDAVTAALNSELCPANLVVRHGERKGYSLTDSGKLFRTTPAQLPH